jgi:Trypsin
MKHYPSLGVIMMLMHILMGNVAPTTLEGRERDLNSCIIGGTRANAKRYPYYTSLRLFYQSGLTSFCAGSLVKADVILTSARCAQHGDDPIVPIKAFVNFTEGVFTKWDLAEYVYARDAKVFIGNILYVHSNLVYLFRVYPLGILEIRKCVRHQNESQS